MLLRNPRQTVDENSVKRDSGGRSASLALRHTGVMAAAVAPIAVRRRVREVVHKVAGCWETTGKAEKVVVLWEMEIWRDWTRGRGTEEREKRPDDASLELLVVVVVVVVPHAKSGEWDLRAINKNFFAASRGARKTHPTLRAILPNRRFAVQTLHTQGW